MNKEKRIKQVAETVQKAVYAFTDAASELPELESTELLIILYGVFLNVAANVEQDPDLIYLFMQKKIGYIKTENGYTLKFPKNLIKGDDE